MTETILFSLIRSELHGEFVDCDLKSPLTENELASLYELSKRHDLGHLVGHVLDKAGVLGEDDVSRSFKQLKMQAIYRYARQEHEFEKICHVLEESQIPYIPLKGIVLRRWYPEPWMRTSSDIDILVKQEDLDPAVKALVQKLNYRHSGTGAHDASLFAQSGVHLELHFRLLDEAASGEQQRILSDIWNHVSPVPGFEYKRQMTGEMFYFYNIVHLAKHFIGGTCGVRPFLDLQIVERSCGYEQASRDALLSQGGLLVFSQSAKELSDVWFAGRSSDPMTEQMAAVVLGSGVHGTLMTNIAFKQAKLGGKLRFILRKIFVPYDTIKRIYPVLNKHKWLLPFCEILRWLRLIFCGELGRCMRVLWKIVTISTEKVNATAELLKQLKL